MDYIAMIEKAREELLQEVNRRCDDLIRRYQEEEQGISPKAEVRERTLAWISPATLKGKRPVALTFASGEVVQTPTWKKVVQTILKHCNEQPDMHERLMQLRGKVFGRQRTILGKVPEEMDVPLQIDKDLYFEAKFDTEALLTMMERKILEPVGYDFSGILIQYTERKQVMSEMPDITQSENREDMPEGIQML
ncbi:MAG: hypothetical protein ENTB_04686 [Enterocloster aldenensis]